MPLISDLSLSITPTTALYQINVPDSQVTVNESTSAGRDAIVLDFNQGDGLYVKDIGTVFQWPTSLGTALYIWQPSIIPLPENSYSRSSDWNDGGYEGAKFVQGYEIEADSLGVAKNAQLQSSDDMSVHPLLEMPATFNKQSIRTFSCAPFISHSVRLISSDGIPWRVWRETLKFQPFPASCLRWETELFNFGLGWQHVRMLNVPYIASAPVTLTLSFDQWPQIVITDQLPATASLITPTKQKVLVPVNKSKLIGFKLTSTSQFRVFKEMLEVWVGQWGRSESYNIARPFGGEARDGAEV